MKTGTLKQNANPINLSVKRECAICGARYEQRYLFYRRIIKNTEDTIFCLCRTCAGIVTRQFWNYIIGEDA